MKSYVATNKGTSAQCVGELLACRAGCGATFGATRALRPFRVPILPAFAHFCVVFGRAILRGRIFTPSDLRRKGVRYPPGGDLALKNYPKVVNRGKIDTEIGQSRRSPARMGDMVCSQGGWDKKARIVHRLQRECPRELVAVHGPASGTPQALIACSEERGRGGRAALFEPASSPPCHARATSDLPAHEPEASRWPAREQ